MPDLPIIACAELRSKGELPDEFTVEIPFQDFWDEASYRRYLRFQEDFTQGCRRLLRDGYEFTTQDSDSGGVARFRRKNRLPQPARKESPEGAIDV